LSNLRARILTVCLDGNESVVDAVSRHSAGALLQRSASDLRGADIGVKRRQRVGETVSGLATTAEAHACPGA
jgi:hypothetical protein